MNADKLIKDVTGFYLKSNQFNGYPCYPLLKNSIISFDKLRTILHELVEDKKLSLVFGDRHPNPHVKAFKDESAESQLQKLKTVSLDHVCIYPTPDYLRKVVDCNTYSTKPYTLELALGAGQLEFRAFDLSVLEVYRNDPRYNYTNDDIHGRISISDEYFESQDIPEKDKILLNTFGFAYDEDFNRAVAVFCFYLNMLSPEHQQVWKSKELTGNYKLHPDYYRACIQGIPGEKMSIFSAFIEEIQIINRMCEIMGRPHLFREDFQQRRPRNFSFLVRPTLDEYNNFVHTLDKIMSDNIKKEFFMDEISDEIEEERVDGKIVVSQKGTIKMLYEWLNSNFRLMEQKLIDELIDIFKEVRKQRQKPAHVLKPNEFDQKYFHSQRKLVIKAYDAIRTIRLIFAIHPIVKVANMDISEYLYQGKIWDY